MQIMIFWVPSCLLPPHPHKGPTSGSQPHLDHPRFPPPVQAFSFGEVQGSLSKPLGSARGGEPHLCVFPEAELGGQAERRLSEASSLFREGTGSGAAGH